MSEILAFQEGVHLDPSGLAASDGLLTESGSAISRLRRLTINAARRVHRLMGRGCSRAYYKLFLANALKEEGLRVATELRCHEAYGDVQVFHAIELVVEDTLLLDFRTATNVLNDPCYTALLEYDLRVAGLQHGLFLSLAGKDVVAVSITDRGLAWLAG